MYGPTETTLAKCCYRVPHGKLDGVQPVGWPLPSTQVLVLARHDRLCGIGEAGEIVIRTPFRTRGYLNASLEDQQRFAVNPFCPSDDQDLVYFTGDGGRYRPDGAVEILGRLDDQVKIRGMRIEPAEINAVLEQHPSVRESVVLARQGDHAQGDKHLVAYVVASGQPAFSARELRQFLRERLPDYMVPSHVVSIDAIPLNANGKVDRRALPAPAVAPIDSPGAHVGPRTAIEDTLVDIWSEVLRHPVLGVHDNFFELGGHSLMAVQVISRVRQVCLIDLPMHTLFEAPTVAGMAEHVEAALTAGDTAHAPPLLPVGRQAPLPLSFSQERMWFIHQLQPDSSAYHIAPAARLKGPFDLAAFERSLTEVVRRHEGLRTVFQVVDGQPVQVITPQPELYLRAVDLRDAPGPLGESRALALARQEAQRPFDLATGPLMRVTVYRLSDDEHLVHNVMHHIISDAWSLGVLMRELATLYNAFVSGAPAVLPEFGDTVRRFRALATPMDARG